MPAAHAFDYAVIRVVPHVEREEFVNVGIILFCRPLRFLDCRTSLDERRVLAFAPDCDLAAVREQLAVTAAICAGGPAAGDLSELGQAERFRWLASPRSTVVQVSPVHNGLSSDPQAALQDLFERLVQPPSVWPAGKETMTNVPEFQQIDHMIANALAEDIGDGDVTTLNTVPEDAVLHGVFLAKEAGVVAGLEVVRRVFAQLDPAVEVAFDVADGDRVEPRQVFGRVRGPGRALLTGERVALNFLQRMSGIATLTRRHVDAVAGTRAVILDTRKTAPGLRALDKWAVRLGGGQNHRIGLYDMAMIKDNHIAAVGSIGEAVRRVRAGDPRGRPIEVEVTTLDQLREALGQPIDRILLDNMSLGQMAEAVRIAAGRIPLEASGNVNLDTVAAIAATGVDYISSGALTHSVKALDISLDLT